MDQNKIGNFLAKLRKEREMTQSQLAEILGVTHQAVSKWENGDSIPDISILMSISKVYEISVDELLAGERKEECCNEADQNDIQPVRDQKSIYIYTSKLVLSFIILISYFITSITIKGDTSDIFPDIPGSDLFSISSPTLYFHITGFDILFRSTSISLLFIGALLLFIGALAVSAYSIITLTSLLSRGNMIEFSNPSLPKKIRLTSLIVSLVGAFIFLIGTFEGTTGFGIFLSIIMLIGLVITEIFENKRSM